MTGLSGARRLATRIEQEGHRRGLQRQGHVLELREGCDLIHAHQVLAEAGVHDADDEDLVIIQCPGNTENRYLYSFPWPRRRFRR
jgi:hypothetical protein